MVPSRIEEIPPEGASPEETVEALARDKAHAVAASRRDALVLGSDTIVVLDGEVLGKPADAAEARTMLERLAGRSHFVYTGVALVHAASERAASRSTRTRVTFAPISREEIALYVAGGSPMDKAGAYGIQDDAGALFVESIEGDYYNVVGLPLRTLYVLLKHSFPDLLAV